ncbi:CHAT domain-containing protein [Streptomyces sp. NPDC020983]|uniref:CHAT domain-containing protein n=1 Tax=Streptomyces sp. NPDC020983 TaxID=3365106 RepID=UPI0037875FA4
MSAEPPGRRGSVVDRQLARAREWDALVARVRSLGPGFADFLRPPRLESLLPAVGTGTLAMVNVTSTRCDALLVEACGVRGVPLPDLDAQEAAERVSGHIDRLGRVDEAAAHVRRTGRRALADPSFGTFHDHHTAKRHLRAAEEELDARLLDDLGWLWRTVADPVLRAAASNRVWWCPTGPLGFLPLHAAGHHDGSGRSVLDRAVPSSVPTLRALARARTELLGGADRMLVIAPAAGPPLPQTAAELDLLRGLFPPHLLTVVEGADATRERVLRELRDHRWAHFSCHGRQNLLDPSHGGLLLADGVLTVAELGAERLDGGFAFLSACMTATGGVRLADEVITLGAGLHYAGFRHVLATLWSVDAEAASAFAAELFPGLVTAGRLDPARTAGAATRAMRRLRDAEPERPSRWAAFTHTGP